MAEHYLSFEERIKRKLCQLSARWKDMNEWEVGFVDSIFDQRVSIMTEKQLDKIEALYKKYCIEGLVK